MYFAEMKKTILQKFNDILEETKELSKEELIDILNKFKIGMHSISPFKTEPVDSVIWIKSEDVQANDYNPNSVAPPEMKLLERSIKEDGYTQPVVTWKNETSFEVVDGFHRNRICKESKIINKRVSGYLPIVIINEDRKDKGDRMASTIRHNRARGKHKVEAMSDIVLDLKRRNWSDEKIAKELGMDADEVLRLVQITGLAEMFKDREFSEAWMVASIDETDGLSDAHETGI